MTKSKSSFPTPEQRQILAVITKNISVILVISGFLLTVGYHAGKIHYQIENNKSTNTDNRQLLSALDSVRNTERIRCDEMMKTVTEIVKNATPNQ